MANNGGQSPIVTAALYVALGYVFFFIVLPIGGLILVAYIFASVFKSVAASTSEVIDISKAPLTTVNGEIIPTEDGKFVIRTSSEKFRDFAGSEPEWTKRIPNWLLCNWFYVFFIINVIVVVALMIGIVGTAMSSSMPKTVRASQLFLMIMQMLASTTSSLFFYVMCDRSLKP
jgi:hypothetical protein